jgi:sugar fermentation stimulation protein A
MYFQSGLIKGRLIRRYKRVLADVLLDSGQMVSAYCPNFGPMIGLCDENTEVWVSINENERRRNRLIWELSLSSGGLVGVNNSRNVSLVAEAIESGSIPEFIGYSSLSRRMKNSTYGSKIDLLLQGDDEQDVCYIGVSNLYMKRTTNAVFPDSITVSDIKQLEELAGAAAEGARAVLFCVAQRMDCLGAKVVWDTNPDYVVALVDAVKKGVELVCYGCMIDLHGIWIDRKLVLDFKI